MSEEKFRVHDVEILRKLGRVRRAVEEIPVWSSYVTVGLTRAGAIGSLELHWPELPPVAVYARSSARWKAMVDVGTVERWSAAFLAREPDYTFAGWIEAYKKVYDDCKPDLTPSEVTEAAYLAFAREGTWNNLKVCAALDAVFGPMPTR